MSPGDAYMRYWTGSSLVHVMACRLFGAKPLPEPMMAYCQLGPTEQRNLYRTENIFIDEIVFENAVCLSGAHLVPASTYLLMG